MSVAGFDLSERRALLVGTGSEVDRAIALAFAEAGARLALAPLSSSGAEHDRIEALRSALARAGAGCPVIRTNLASSGATERVVAEAREQLGGLDVLVVNAVRQLAGPFESLTDGDLDRLVVLTLTRPVRLLRDAGRAMLANGGGRIIVVHSILGQRGVANTAAFAACQSALTQLIRSLAIEWARSAIRVNGIGLGWFANDPSIPEADGGRIARFLPSKRLGTPDDVGALAVYLASPSADLMTGQSVAIDGGALVHA